MKNECHILLNPQEPSQLLLLWKTRTQEGLIFMTQGRSAGLQVLRDTDNPHAFSNRRAQRSRSIEVGMQHTVPVARGSVLSGLRAPRASLSLPSSTVDPTIQAPSIHVVQLRSIQSPSPTRRIPAQHN